MTLSIISLIAIVVSAIVEIAMFIVAAFCLNKWMRDMGLIISDHTQKIHQIKRTIKEVTQEMYDLEKRLNELDQKTTDDCSGSSGESD